MTILEVLVFVLVYALLCAGLGAYIAGPLRQGRPWHWALLAAYFFAVAFGPPMLFNWLTQ